MRYLCLVYYDEKRLDALSKREYDRLVDEVVSYREALRNSGHYITSDALEPVDTAVTLRVRNGQLSTIDGPFAETKEQLGGFLLIEARDLNEAIRVAAQLPPMRLGCVEVRPVREHIDRAQASRRR
jgi:hypothetical protein